MSRQAQAVQHTDTNTKRKFDHNVIYPLRGQDRHTVVDYSFLCPSVLPSHSWDGSHHPDLSHYGGSPVGHVPLLLPLEVFPAQRRWVQHGSWLFSCLEMPRFMSVKGNKWVDKHHTTIHLTHPWSHLDTGLWKHIWDKSLVNFLNVENLYWCHAETSISGFLLMVSTHTSVTYIHTGKRSEMLGVLSWNVRGGDDCRQLHCCDKWLWNASRPK